MMFLPAHDDVAVNSKSEYVFIPPQCKQGQILIVIVCRRMTIQSGARTIFGLQSGQLPLEQIVLVQAGQIRNEAGGKSAWSLTLGFPGLSVDLEWWSGVAVQIC